MIEKGALPSTATGYVSPSLEGRRHPREWGHGVFACTPIRAESVLVVWGGEVVTAGELGRLTKRQRERLCMQVEDGLFLLTAREGPADWVNHSCAPNAGLRGQIVLVAMRDIAAGEEVCFDYAMCDTEPYAEFDCWCGTPACRKRVTHEDWGQPELQERYRGYFAPHVQARIDEALAATSAPGPSPTGRSRGRGAPPRAARPSERSEG